MAYSYLNSKGQTYYLHSTEVKLKGSGMNQRIFYFARQVGDKALNDLPEGYEVVENKRTGLPIIRKKR